MNETNPTNEQQTETNGSYPKDVLDIIEYSELRKKHRDFDLQLRKIHNFKNELTLSEMYVLLRELKQYDKKMQTLWKKV